MLRPHEKVVVGVSGGADSVCLFLLLLEYARQVPLSFAAVHVNHGIRREAGEDARFVERLCRERRVPFFLVEEDVRRLAQQEGYSEEDAGRRVRYNAFSNTAKRLGGAKIAVAHNSNDNAETMLFHLFRGSGLKGLSGIAPVRGNIIRPILCLERREVEAYLKSVSAGWCLDGTNQGDAYRRNRIRHHILPYAEEWVAAGAVEHMGRTAELLREAESYLEAQTQEAMAKCVEVRLRPGKAGEEAPCREIAGEAEKQTDRIWSGEGEFVPRKELFRVDTAYFQEIPPILQKRVILELLKTLSPTGKDISAVHVMDTLELLKREGNRSISLPFGIRAWRQYGNVFLEQGRKVSVLEETMAQKDLPAETRGTAVLGGIEAPTGGGDRVRAPGVVLLGPEIFRTSFVYDLGHRGKIEFAGFYMKKGEEVPLKRYTKWFDCDKIKQCVEIRTRRQGDYLTIADKRGNTVHKSLKDYMITEKIPREIRDEIPVIAVGSHVLWLAGWRISQAFKVDDNTKRVLQVRLLGTKFGGSSETEEKNGGKH